MILDELIIVVPLIAACLVLSRLSRRRERGVRNLEEPACGACGYSSRGLTTLVCPECGSDLRVVGIGRIPQARSRGIIGLVVGAIVVSLAVLCAGEMLARLLVPLVPETLMYSRNVSVVPFSDLKRTYAISMQLEAQVDAPPSVDVMIQTSPDSRASAGSTALTFDAVTGGYRYTGSDGQLVKAQSGFGPEAVLAWMAAAGVDTGDAKVEVEAARLTGLARQTGRLPPPDGMSGGGSSSSSGGQGPFVTINSRHVNASPITPGARGPVTWALRVLTIAVWVVLLAALWRLRRRTSRIFS